MVFGEKRLSQLAVVVVMARSFEELQLANVTIQVRRTGPGEHTAIESDFGQCVAPVPVQLLADCE
jgi:hypothetical protein